MSITLRAEAEAPAPLACLAGFGESDFGSGAGVAV
jgi:hypothetical protein